VGGSSQDVRFASGRGREGLAKMSADAPTVFLNSLYTDFLLKFIIRKSISYQNDTLTRQGRGSNGKGQGGVRVG